MTNLKHGKYKMVEKKCECCGKTFRRNKLINKYCSPSCYSQAKIGSNVLEETKKKMSLAHKGNTYGLKNLKKGKEHWNWKGGISPLNHSLRTSAMFKIWRNAVFLRDNFTCQNPNCEYCHNQIGIMLHPHHIKSFAEFPELRFIISNGVTYCKEYHLNSKLHNQLNTGGIKI
jgi:hypothetical protein